MSAYFVPQMIVIRSRSQSRREMRVTDVGPGAEGLGMGLNPSLAAPGPSYRSLRAPGTLAERRDEEDDERDQQHINDEGLDQDETQDQRATDVAGRARIARNGLGGSGDRLALPERAERRRDA